MRPMEHVTELPETVVDRLARHKAEPDLVVEADSLFQGKQALIIEFRGERYRLSQTRNGKLILTK